MTRGLHQNTIHLWEVISLLGEARSSCSKIECRSWVCAMANGIYEILWIEASFGSWDLAPKVLWACTVTIKLHSALLTTQFNMIEPNTSRLTGIVSRRGYKIKRFVIPSWRLETSQLTCSLKAYVVLVSISLLANLACIISKHHLNFVFHLSCINFNIKASALAYFYKLTKMVTNY